MKLQAFKLYHIQKLVEVFEQRRSKNSQYSLRAYAQTLGMNSGSLSAVLSGKRSLPSNMAQSVMRKLNLSDSEKDKFVLSMFQEEKLGEASIQIDMSSLRMIYEEYEYFLILEAFNLTQFQCSAEWISRNLELPLERTKTCLKNLESLNLISQDAKGQWSKAYIGTYSSQNTPPEILDQMHLVTLKTAADKLESVPEKGRDYSFLTIALDEEQFRNLKRLNHQYLNKVMKLSESSSKTKLYKIAVQVFPVSLEQEALKPESCTEDIVEVINSLGSNLPEII